MSSFESATKTSMPRCKFEVSSFGFCRTSPCSREANDATLGAIFATFFAALSERTIVSTFAGGFTGGLSDGVTK